MRHKHYIRKYHNIPVAPNFSYVGIIELALKSYSEINIFVITNYIRLHSYLMNTLLLFLMYTYFKVHNLS
jgi:hypothetical protein